MRHRATAVRHQASASVVFVTGSVAALAWAIMIAQATSMQTPHGIAASWAMWMLMMIAMMLPPVIPWLLAYAAVADSAVRTTVFASGYMITWGAFGLVAATLQMTLAQQGALHALLMHSQTGVGALLLVGAGIYQLVPTKSACLKHCRSPMSFFLSSWRGGRWGAFRMGTEHGAYCVGCCWALMALAFAVGVMNLAWMAVLTIVLCIEKIAARGEAWSRLFGAALIIWGALWALGA